MKGLSLKSLFAAFFMLVFLGASAQKNKIEIVELHTSMGNIYLWLHDKTPQHKANFLKLAKEGFYDSLLFHRVIRDFMVQGGDPNTRDSTQKNLFGQGGPGYTVPAEFDTTFIHKKGALAAARMPDKMNPEKASSGSQFYIVQGKIQSDDQLSQIQNYIRSSTPYKNFTYTQEMRNAYTSIGGTPHLDMQYTVFGEVISGLDVVDKIAAIPTNKNDLPDKPVVMKMKVLSLSAKQLKKKFGFIIPA